MMMMHRETAETPWRRPFSPARDEQHGTASPAMPRCYRPPCGSCDTPGGIMSTVDQDIPAGFEAAVAEADEFCRGLRGPVGHVLVVLAKAGRSIGCTIGIDPTPATIAHAASVVATHIRLAGGPAAHAMAWGSPSSAAFSGFVAAVTAAWLPRIKEVQEAGGVPVAVLCISEAGGTWPYLRVIERSAA
jgi:hypothetical protein